MADLSDNQESKPPTVRYLLMPSLWLTWLLCLPSTTKKAPHDWLSLLFMALGTTLFVGLFLFLFERFRKAGWRWKLANVAVLYLVAALVCWVDAKKDLGKQEAVMMRCLESLKVSLEAPCTSTPLGKVFAKHLSAVQDSIAYYARAIDATNVFTATRVTQGCGHIQEINDRVKADIEGEFSALRLEAGSLQLSVWNSDGAREVLKEGVDLMQTNFMGPYGELTQATLGSCELLARARWHFDDDGGRVFADATDASAFEGYQRRITAVTDPH